MNIIGGNRFEGLIYLPAVSVCFLLLGRADSVDVFEVDGDETASAAAFFFFAGGSTSCKICDFFGTFFDAACFCCSLAAIF
jgi:hypothetical protein